MAPFSVVSFPLIMVRFDPAQFSTMLIALQWLIVLCHPFKGTTAVLRGYGFACIFVLVGFVLVCFYHRGKGLTTDLTPAEDPHQVAAEMAHLAPHGVPGNPTIVRTASTANLENSASKPTLNYNTSHGNLDIPNVGGENEY